MLTPIEPAAENDFDAATPMPIEVVLASDFAAMTRSRTSIMAIDPAVPVAVSDAPTRVSIRLTETPADAAPSLPAASVSAVEKIVDVSSAVILRSPLAVSR